MPAPVSIKVKNYTPKNQKNKKPQEKISIIKKKVNKTKKVTSTGPSMNEKVARAKKSVETFANALVSPFAPEAVGAKVPDLYAFPTNSYHMRTTQVLGLNQSTFGAIYLANPLATCIDVGAIVLGSGAQSITQPGDFYQLGAGSGVGYSCVYGATKTSILAGVCQSFRVVGGGIRIRNLQAPLTASGRIYVAVVPIANGGMPDYLTMDTLAVPDAGGYKSLFNNLGLPSPITVFSGSLQELPLNSNYTVSSLLTGDSIDINFQVFNPVAFTFKAAQENNSVNTSLGTINTDSLTVDLGGAYGGVNKDNMQSDGTAAIITYFEGFPITGNSPIEIDYVLHMETTPLVSLQQFNAGGGMTPVSDSPPLSLKGSTMACETVLSAANAPSNIIRDVSSAINAAQKYDREELGGLGSVALTTAIKSACAFMLV